MIITLEFETHKDELCRIIHTVTNDDTTETILQRMILLPPTKLKEYLENVIKDFDNVPNIPE